MSPVGGADERWHFFAKRDTQCLEQAGDGVALWLAESALQILDGAWTDAGALRECSLRQARGEAVLTQLITEALTHLRDAAWALSLL